MTAKEILELLQKRATELRDRANLRSATGLTVQAQTDWEVADVLDGLIFEIKQRDPNL